jgi:hypothetical protein
LLEAGTYRTEDTEGTEGFRVKRLDAKDR